MSSVMQWHRFSTRCLCHIPLVLRVYSLRSTPRCLRPTILNTYQLQQMKRVWILFKIKMWMVGVTLRSQNRMEVSGEIGQNHRMQPRDHPWIHQDPQLMHIFGINQFSARPIGGFKTGLKWTSKRVLTHRIHKTTLWRNLDWIFMARTNLAFVL